MTKEDREEYIELNGYTTDEAKLPPPDGFDDETEPDIDPVNTLLGKSAVYFAIAISATAFVCQLAFSLGATQ